MEGCNKGGVGGCAVSLPPPSPRFDPRNPRGRRYIGSRGQRTRHERDPNPVNRDTDPRSNPPPLQPPCFARRFPVYARRRNIDFAELEHTREHGAIIRKLPLPSSVQSFPSPRSGQWMDNFEEKRLDSSFYNKIIR